MQNSITQNKTTNELLDELKNYEQREKAFKIHLKMQDNEIKNLEKEIKKLRGEKNQFNNEDNEMEEESDIASGEDMKQEQQNEDKNIYIDPYLNEYLNNLIDIIKYKNKESQEKYQKVEQLQTLDSNREVKQAFKRCREIIKENLELYNLLQVGILENLKFENGLEKSEIEQLMIKLKALERYKNDLEAETEEVNERINMTLEKQ